MKTLEALADELALSVSQVRRRLDALRTLGVDGLIRGRNGRLHVPDSLALALAEMVRLEKEGLPMREAARLVASKLSATPALVPREAGVSLVKDQETVAPFEEILVELQKLRTWVEVEGIALALVVGLLILLLWLAR